MKTIIVDTDILIDVSRQVQEAIDYLAVMEQTSVLAVSIITKMELLVGCRNKMEMRTTELFLERFDIVQLNERISDLATDLLVRYRLSHGLSIPDALIAATAVYFEKNFVTKNQKDFRFIAELMLLPYPLEQGAW